MNRRREIIGDRDSDRRRYRVECRETQTCRKTNADTTRQERKEEGERRAETGTERQTDR